MSLLMSAFRRRCKSCFPLLHEMKALIDTFTGLLLRLHVVRIAIWIVFFDSLLSVIKPFWGNNYSNGRLLPTDMGVFQPWRLYAFVELNAYCSREEGRKSSMSVLVETLSSEVLCLLCRDNLKKIVAISSSD